MDAPQKIVIPKKNRHNIYIYLFWCIDFSNATFIGWNTVF